MAVGDPYYENLIKNVAEGGGLAAGVASPNVGRIRKFLGSRGAKVGIGSLIAWMALDKLLEAGNLAAERGVRREALRTQATLGTPENLYQQASLSTAREEEEQARQALFGQILGGVTGPSISLARGERIIGGG